MLDGRRPHRAGDARLERGRRARPSACAARKRRRTTATSPTRTCRRSSSTTRFVDGRARARCRSCRATKRARFVDEHGPDARTPRRCSRRTRASRRSSRRRRRSTGDARRKVANFVQSEVLRDVQTHGLVGAASGHAAPGRGAPRARRAGRRSAASRPRRSTRRSPGPTRAPADVVAELGMAQVSDAGRHRGDLPAASSTQNPKQAEQLRAGKADAPRLLRRAGR